MSANIACPVLADNGITRTRWLLQKLAAVIATKAMRPTSDTGVGLTSFHSRDFTSAPSVRIHGHARLAAALTTCQVALGVIPSPQILSNRSSRLTLRKIAPVCDGSCPNPLIDGALRPQRNRNGTDVLSLANKVSNHAMILADLKTSRPESRQFRPSQAARNRQSRASTENSQAKGQYPNCCAFPGVHRHLPTVQYLDFAVPTEANRTNRGRTLLCRSRIAQGISDFAYKCA